MMRFQKYRKKGMIEMRPATLYERANGLPKTIFPFDVKPEMGDMIARDPNNRPEIIWIIQKNELSNYEKIE